MAGELAKLKSIVSKFRYIETGLWSFLSEDPINHQNILKNHGMLQKYITELYTEITSIGKEHDLFEHMKSDYGKSITEMLRQLRLLLIRQYEDLLAIQGTNDKDKISEILNGNKNGLNESETSQRIKQIELELEKVELKEGALWAHSTITDILGP